MIVVARSAELLASLGDELGGSITTVVADVADPVVAGRLIERYRPDTLVLNAGSAPLSRPLHQHTWDSFSRTWDVDLRHAFHWIREALLLPLHPGSTVITMSSGAAVAGSPLSGGYAGAKATIRFITGYAAEESARAGLGIRFVSLLPKLTPSTELGSAAVAAYARRGGIDLEEYLEGLGPYLVPEDVGKATVDLVSSAEYAPGAAAYIGAFERHDVEALVGLLREDAIVEMPPFDLWLRGMDDIRQWLIAVDALADHLLTPLDANGSPAAAVYRPASPGGPPAAFAIHVLDVVAGQIGAIHSFIDPELFQLLGLPDQPDL